jgi:hypothetical protein
MRLQVRRQPNLNAAQNMPNVRPACNRDAALVYLKHGPAFVSSKAAVHAGTLRLASRALWRVLEYVRHGALTGEV